MNTNHNKLRFFRSLSLPSDGSLVTFRTPKDIYFSLYHCNSEGARAESAVNRHITGSLQAVACVCVCVYLPYITHIFHTERALAIAASHLKARHVGNLFVQERPRRPVQIN